ncbi:peptidase domain-containing ABC transporter [Carboxylicivirga mesophila]|uniref:Peptidase domain-containing ABC transporter n=1 Tax=Carboxylicivirga mesophila TaxID=1166478 RepID=A0ABS5K459_9BACT|nr:peptidase domain-containing ABC transporter [Carboxylicivirga mesophila]MBS2209818.1 peptidase domain-containing ABC transporter [Carboxylicivirga mesophila]
MKIKQRDITDCGAACLASIASHYKLKLPVSRIRQLAGTDKKGTNVLGLIKAAEKLGFTAKGVKGGIDALPKIPLPAIAHVIVKEVLQHYVVIYKVSATHVEYMDPGDGQMHKVMLAEFEKQWTGVLVLFAPNDDFVSRNEKVSNFRRFVFLLQPHKSMLLQALVGAILYTILGLSTSIYIQKITDYVLVDGNTKLLNLLSVGMLVILLFQIFIGAAKTILMLRTGQLIDARLILGYYKHLLRLPQRFFDTMRVGEIISRINDAVKIRAFINDTAVSLLVNVFIVLFSFGLMFIYSWKLALIMAVVIPLYALTYFITNRLNKKQERKVMEHAAELESQLVESLNSVRTIKQFGLEDFTNVKTEVRFITLLKTVYKSGLNSIFSGNSSEFLSRVFTIILLWVGSYFVIDQSITPGELLSFYAIIGYFTSPAAGLIGMNKTVQNALIAADRLFEIMDLERESEENKIDLRKELLGDINFENVSFSYGTRVDVFEDFSLTIPKGRLTAIIGESGSGKTTLAALIQKLYPLNKGSISIGQHNINYFSNDSLRQLVASVPQKLDLFAGNVVENIAVGEFNPDMERVLEVCNQLGILKFIEGLPNGFNTYLGENGASLSGGQKQRLAIARALYRHPEVLILDEATSSLDSESESHVQAAIDVLKQQGKTIVVIAHRLSTVMNADKIVVLEGGRLMEEGTHYQLFEQKGKYYKMWEKQMPQISEEFRVNT